jgi:hypothetical protein
MNQKIILKSLFLNGIFWTRFLDFFFRDIVIHLQQNGEVFDSPPVLIFCQNIFYNISLF